MLCLPPLRRRLPSALDSVLRLLWLVSACPSLFLTACPFCSAACPRTVPCVVVGWSLSRIPSPFHSTLSLLQRTALSSSLLPFAHAPLAWASNTIGTYAHPPPLDPRCGPVLDVRPRSRRLHLLQCPLVTQLAPKSTLREGHHRIRPISSNSIFLDRNPQIRSSRPRQMNVRVNGEPTAVGDEGRRQLPARTYDDDVGERTDVPTNNVDSEGFALFDPRVFGEVGGIVDRASSNVQVRSQYGQLN